MVLLVLRMLFLWNLECWINGIEDADLVVSDAGLLELRMQNY